MRVSGIDRHQVLEDRHCSTSEWRLIESIAHMDQPEHELGQEWLVVLKVSLVLLTRRDRHTDQCQACLELLAGEVDDRSSADVQERRHRPNPLVPALELGRVLERVDGVQQRGCFLWCQMDLSHEHVSSDHDSVQHLREFEPHDDQESHAGESVR